MRYDWVMTELDDSLADMRGVLGLLPPDDDATPLVQAAWDLVRAIEATMPEWEYAKEYDFFGEPQVRVVSEADARERKPDGHRADGSPYWNYKLLRRRKAGQWEPADASS